MQGRSAGRDWPCAPPTGPVKHMLSSEASGVDYRVAADFVHFLIETYGVARYKRFHQLTKIRSLEKFWITS